LEFIEGELVVDALFVGRESAAKVNFDFSTLINCLDGVTTREGLLVFLTTNRANLLDQALCRPGRIAYRIRFDLPSLNHISAAMKKLGAQWASEHGAFLEAIKGFPLTIAALQQFLFDSQQMERTSILPYISELEAIVVQHSKATIAQASTTQ